MKISVSIGGVIKAIAGAGGKPLGDTVKNVTSALGIKKDCGGCDKRRKSLNRFTPPK